MKKTALLLLLLLTLSLVTGIRPALATLGQKADSVARDRRALAATQKTTEKRVGYSVQELALDSTTVREFINSAGVVFAIAWSGMTHPDFDTILGAYASEFWTAKQARPRKHGQKRLKIQSDRVVVETWGHMRNLQGRAYLPALVPEGVAIDEIR